MSTITLIGQKMKEINQKMNENYSEEKIKNPIVSAVIVSSSSYPPHDSLTMKVACIEVTCIIDRVDGVIIYV